MTDPDERIINRAIAYVGDKTCSPGELQDIREEARAALHRLFRDRRRLEARDESWRKEAQYWADRAEELETALRKIQSELEDPAFDLHTAMVIGAIARRALERRRDG